MGNGSCLVGAGVAQRVQGGCGQRQAPGLHLLRIKAAAAMPSWWPQRLPSVSGQTGPPLPPGNQYGLRTHKVGRGVSGTKAQWPGSHTQACPRPSPPAPTSLRVPAGTRDWEREAGHPRTTPTSSHHGTKMGEAKQCSAVPTGPILHGPMGPGVVPGGPDSALCTSWGERLTGLPSLQLTVVFVLCPRMRDGRCYVSGCWVNKERMCLGHSWGARAPPQCLRHETTAGVRAAPVSAVGDLTSEL